MIPPLGKKKALTMRVLIFSHLTIITLQDLAPLAIGPWLLWVHRAIPSATLDEHMEF